jgi:hypothetical protein
MRTKLLITLTGFLAVFSLAAAPVAFAQSNNQVVNGLCEGANLHFTDTPSASCDSGGQSITEKVNNFLKHLINIFSAIIGVVAVIMIIFGGFRYITSGGNDSSVTSAKNTIMYAIIGLVIVALAQLLVRFVLRLASA